MNPLIAVAQGEQPADLLVKNARLVNVLSGEVHKTSVAVSGGYVAALEDCDARETVDAAGRFLCPGLVEGHIHVESTLLLPSHLARIAAAHGTAAVVCDPHEIANVLGMRGVQWMLDATRDLPVAFYVMMPSCVPATHLETSGAIIAAADMARMLADNPERMPGLGEMMNFPGVLGRDPQVMAKLGAARGKLLDGHAPMLRGRGLSAYIAAGIDSDHESTTAKEALEKLRKGMHLMLREGSAEHNLLDLLPVVSQFNSANCSLVSDDRHPDDLLADGHLDHSIRMAIRAGVPPVRAVQMASINTARHFRIAGRGAVAPGYRADFLLLDDLESFAISKCYLGGVEVEKLAFDSDAPLPGNTMHLGRPLTPELFAIPATGGKARVIGIVPGQLVTQSLALQVPVHGGQAHADPACNLAKLAVIERHTGSGNVGLGFVQGLGLVRGAIASSVAHDSHNIIVAGQDDASMALAASAVAEAGGGFAVADEGRVAAMLPLPVAGLMSDRPLDEVVLRLRHLNAAARKLMKGQEADPFMILSFLALPVIPSLKLTDKGLVDVDRFEHVPLFSE